MSIKDMMEAVPNYTEPAQPFSIVWGLKGMGWGELYFYIGEDRKVHCGNELMSKKFIKERLCQMVDDCILDDPPSVAYRENDG